jgi:hypothetical protein
VSLAFQQATAYPGADVFRFNILVDRTKMRLQFTPHRLSLNRFLFTGTASLSAGVPTTM